MRDLLPNRELLIEFADIVNIPLEYHRNGIPFQAELYEDNSSAISLSVSHRLTNRTRHYNIKYHFFWDAVKQGYVIITKIHTNKQEADYLTKGSSRTDFERIRLFVQG